MAYAAPLVWTSEGTYSVLYRSTDNAGNQEAVRSQSIRIDETAPTLTFGMPAPAANAAGWNNTNVAVPFTAGDNVSGVAGTNPASSPLQLTAEGPAINGTVTVIDAAGNSATFTSPSFAIDKIAPVSSAGLGGTAGANGAYTSDVAISLSAIDNAPAGSGVATLQYSLDGGTTWGAYSSPVVITAEGTTNMLHRSSDNAGNLESPKSVIVRIERIPPVSN
jgi:hypothetical protein